MCKWDEIRNKKRTKRTDFDFFLGDVSIYGIITYGRRTFKLNIFNIYALIKMLHDLNWFRLDKTFICVSTLQFISISLLHNL